MAINAPQNEEQLGRWWRAHRMRVAGNPVRDEDVPLAPITDVGSRWDAVRTYGELFKNINEVGGIDATTGYAAPREEGAAGDIARHAWSRLGGPQLFAAATAQAEASALQTDRAVRNIEQAQAAGSQQSRRRRRPSILVDGIDDQSLLLAGVG